MVARRDHIANGNVKSCGCLPTLRPKREDLTGKTIKGSLVYGYISGGKYRILSSCGHYSDVDTTYLKKKSTPLCNTCSKIYIGKSRAIHGKSHSKGAYSSWLCMRRRCYDEGNNRYPLYGEKGVIVCKRWRNSFENFYSDMGERPDNHSLERIDYDKGYSPENCKWASAVEQANNKRNNVLVTNSLNGKCLSLRRWCISLGLDCKSAYHKYRYKKLPITELLGESFYISQDNYKGVDRLK